ncbi:prolyl oligopeptidase family serine peptidase [Polaribacter sp. Asnod6-C07]|uniref:carboxylesterase family protein n=1 Tax=Polaribacter sp. Asnod6-C07 TaxID=3160582 RepID=UPI003870047A
MKKTYFSSNGFKLPYRLFIPKLNKNKKLPLVIFLHGRGERGTKNGSEIYRNAGFIMNKNSLITPKSQNKYPCYVLVPQCSDKTENEEWAKWIGNSPETPFKGLGKDGAYQINPIPSDSGKATLELIEQLIKEKSIDSSRIYITGLSMGGFGTWDFIARKPNLFAAAIPMAGYSDPNQIQKIKEIPIWIFHGNKDKWNPVEGSRNMYKLLSEINADVKYTEYNLGHGATFKKAFQEPEFIPWLFSKSK